jgi:hypothetical protein
MLSKVELFPATAVTATVNGGWVDMAKHSGRVAGATVHVSAFTSGTIDVLVQTSPDQTNVLTLATCAQATGLAYTFDIPDAGNTLPPDAFRWVRARVVGASTPIATVAVTLWLQDR